jgi:hypothetical protein
LVDKVQHVHGNKYVSSKPGYPGVHDERGDERGACGAGFLKL